MKSLSCVAVVSAAVLLAACDQVRLPGVDAAEEAAPEEVSGPVLDAEDPETDDEDASLPPTDTPEGSETPTVDRDAGPPAAGPDGTAAAPAALRLAQLNAVRCALPADAAPTPTVASVAGATELEEPMVGAEAVNALAATLSAFPGIVKIEPRRTEASGAIASGHCGAVRVRENWLLTAAHCVDQPYDEIRVIGDAANLRSPAARVTAAGTAICHGGYLGTDNGYSNDIALLRLTPEQAAAIPGVPVARIGATSLPLAPVNYPRAEMAGWGLTRFGGQLSNDLLFTPLKVTAVGPAAISVASEDGAGPCIGDSGGPLYVTEADGTKTVVGVLSVVEQNRTTGQFCAGDYNGRYTNLQGFTGWIDTVIALCEAEPDACR